MECVRCADRSCDVCRAGWSVLDVLIGHVTCVGLGGVCWMC